MLAALGAALLAAAAAGRDELTAIVQLDPLHTPGTPPGPAQLAVASLFAGNGTVASVEQPFGKPADWAGGGMSGACNAGFDAAQEVWHKTTADGHILTVSARTGDTLWSAAMSGGPQRSTGGETFLAGPDSRGLFYSAEPLARTSYSVLSYNVSSGAVALVSQQPKGEMDGIGVCVGFVDSATDSLYYIVAESLAKMDLKTANVTQALAAFVAPVRLDPSRPGTVLGVTTQDGGPDQAQVTALSRFDLGAADAAPTVLYTFNETYYHKLCHCSLPLRPQDQADMDVTADGKTVYVVMSYNDKPTHHESLITRGLFVLDVSEGGASATLRSHDVAWKQGAGVAEPHIASMGVFQDGR